jgi:hypothetical protein
MACFTNLMGTLPATAQSTFCIESRIDCKDKKTSTSAGGLGAGKPSGSSTSTPGAGAGKPADDSTTTPGAGAGKPAGSISNVRTSSGNPDSTTAGSSPPGVPIPYPTTGILEDRSPDVISPTGPSPTRRNITKDVVVPSSKSRQSVR